MVDPGVWAVSYERGTPAVSLFRGSSRCATRRPRLPRARRRRLVRHRERVTSLIRKRAPLGPYRRPMPRAGGGSQGGWAFSHGRGTPVASPASRASSPSSLVSYGGGYFLGARYPCNGAGLSQYRRASFLLSSSPPLQGYLARKTPFHHLGPP
jgi:hypothetical protein